MSNLIHRGLEHPVVRTAYAVVDGSPITDLVGALEAAERACGVSVWSAGSWQDVDANTDLPRMMSDLQLVSRPGAGAPTEWDDAARRFLDATAMAIGAGEFCNEYLLHDDRGFVLQMTWRTWAHHVADWMVHRLGAPSSGAYAYMDWYMMPRDAAVPVQDYRHFRDALLRAVQIKTDRRVRARS